MSIDDFCGCTEDEFGCIYKSWRELYDSAYKDDWSRMRMLATIVIQPHVKSKITPQKLLPLPWEKIKPRIPKSDNLTADESKQRFESVLKRIGK